MLLTKPKKKLNLLKRLPNDEKYNPKSKIVNDPMVFAKGSIKLNNTGMQQTQYSTDSTMSLKTAARTATAQSEITGVREGTRKGRTRKQIIAEFFCSQNWNYLSKKILMVKNERDQFKQSIVKYRRFKIGLRKFWQVYKVWITKIKAQREEQKRIEEIKLQNEKAEQLRLEETKRQQELKNK